MRHLATCVFLVSMLSTQGQWRFEGDSSASWSQAVERFGEMARQHAGAHMEVLGRDDDGHPVHLFILSDGSGFTPDSIRAAGKNILWITNGIHPGEPDGIDASLLLAQALLESDQLMGLLVHTAVCIVPVYNVSGCLQRGSSSRANQNGPAEYGFRGNAKNLDLNRDFMKMDSENARSLAAALTRWDPDVYFETHVTDGADHRYIMALLTTQMDRLGGPLRQYMEELLLPGLHGWMEHREQPMCPYFETRGSVPEEGLVGFCDGPRYSTGWNALFNRVGIISEAHMLKPFADRVNATFQLMLATLDVMGREPQRLRESRAAAKEATRTATGFGLNWVLDTTAVEDLPWKGWAVQRDSSSLTGQLRIRYDHARPVDTIVPWYGTFRPGFTESKPLAYLVPRQWDDVVRRLRLCGVPMEPLPADTVLTVEQDSMGAFTTVPMAYEGHWLHAGIQAVRRRKQMPVHAGDWLVPMGHSTDRYVVEALACRASDGFFAWNFFDGVLQQKEWFDPYVFEDKLAPWLGTQPGLNAEFLAKRAAEPAFAMDQWAQLAWLYRRSPWMEPGFRKHPVLRVVQ